MKYNTAGTRIDWIDICKFLAITIMCLGHIGVPANISDLLHIFHMPVFFLLSGICFKAEKYTDFPMFLKARCKTLLIPHLFWSITMYIVWRMYCKFSMLGRPVSFPSFLWMILTKDASDVQFGGFGVIQWFFTSLFFAELLFYSVLTISQKCKHKKEMIFLLCLCLALAGFFVSKLTSYNPLGIVASFMGVLFYGVGFIWKNYYYNGFDKKINNMRAIFQDIGILIVLFIIVLFVWKYNGSTNMRTSSYNNFMLFVLGAIAGSYILIYASHYIEKISQNRQMFLYRYMLYIGQNTLIILVFNRLVQFTIVKTINSILNIFISGEMAVTLIWKVCLVLLDLSIEMVAFVPIIWLINRYLPITVGRKKHTNL